MNAWGRLERDDDVAIVVIHNPPTNAGSAEVRRGLLDAIESVDRDDTIAAAVLIGAGGTFTLRQEEDERWTRQVVQARSIKAD